MHASSSNSRYCTAQTWRVSNHRWHFRKGGVELVFVISKPMKKTYTNEREYIEWQSCCDTLGLKGCGLYVKRDIQEVPESELVCGHRLCLVSNWWLVQCILNTKQICTTLPNAFIYCKLVEPTVGIFPCMIFVAWRLWYGTISLLYLIMCPDTISCPIFPLRLQLALRCCWFHLLTVCLPEKTIIWLSVDLHALRRSCCGCMWPYCTWIRKAELQPYPSAPGTLVTLKRLPIEDITVSQFQGGGCQNLSRTTI